LFLLHLDDYSWNNEKHFLGNFLRHLPERKKGKAAAAKGFFTLVKIVVKKSSPLKNCSSLIITFPCKVKKNLA
jgi:hypothetical protein